VFLSELYIELHDEYQAKITRTFYDSEPSVVDTYTSVYLSKEE